MSVFDIDYNVKGWQALPVRLRQAIQYAWVKVCVRGVVALAEVFKSNRTANVYVCKHNSQVCFLEGALNDVFDAVDRGIYIDDPVYVDPVYVYRNFELKPVYIYKDVEAQPVYVYKDSELYSAGGVQFVVFVPVALVYDVDRLKALVNFYRLASKWHWTIETY